LTIVLPYRWAFFLETDERTRQGLLYEICGIRGSYWYWGPQRSYFLDPEQIRIVMIVGQITPDQVARLNDLIEQVKVFNDELSDWNCREWVLDGLASLKKEMLVDGEYTRESVEELLRERLELEVDSDDE
jgi:hypothetical protein